MDMNAFQRQQKTIKRHHIKLGTFYKGPFESWRRKTQKVIPIKKKKVCTIPMKVFMFLPLEKILLSSSAVQLGSASVSGFYDVLRAPLQFEPGLHGLHGFGGHLGALRQQRCLLSWSLRLDILQQEVADEKLQALPQHSELGNS